MSGKCDLSFFICEKWTTGQRLWCGTRSETYTSKWIPSCNHPIHISCVVYDKCLAFCWHLQMLGGIYTIYSKLFDYSRVFPLPRLIFWKRFIRKTICNKGRTYQGNGESKSEYGIIYILPQTFNCKTQCSLLKILIIGKSWIRKKTHQSKQSSVQQCPHSSNV